MNKDNKQKTLLHISLDHILKYNALSADFDEYITEESIEKSKKVIFKIAEITKKTNRKKPFSKDELNLIERNIFTGKELYIKNVHNKYTNVIDRLHDLDIGLFFFTESLSKKEKNAKGKLKERVIKFLLDKYSLDQVSLFEKILVLTRDILKIKQKKVSGNELHKFLDKIKEKDLEIFKILDAISKNLINGDIIFKEKNISTRKIQNDFKHNNNHGLMSHTGWNDDYINLVEKIHDFTIGKGIRKEGDIIKSLRDKNNQWYFYTLNLFNNLSKNFKKNM